MKLMVQFKAVANEAVNDFTLSKLSVKAWNAQKAPIAKHVQFKYPKNFMKYPLYVLEYSN